MPSGLSDILGRIDASSDAVTQLQRTLVSIPAISPDSEGLGEQAKARAVQDWLTAHGIADVTLYQAPDSRVPSGNRPSLKAVIPGRDTSRTFWVISHLDIVPPGDLALWTSDPYQLVVDGDVLIGRGVEDNHQGIVSSLLVAKALAAAGETPPMNYAMLLVADEENGSKFGLDWLLKTHPEIFGKNDLYLVPDFGVPTSEMVEVAEKSMFWLKITVLGKQCHASSPEEGINTLVASAAFILGLTALHERFPAVDPLFSPPFSTFAPTKKEANVENINTIPGRDVFYLDCRVLPQYDIDDALSAVREIGAEISGRYGVAIEYDIVQKEQAAPATPQDAPVVTRLISAVRRVYGGNPRALGVGGGTVAAFLRRAGLFAVVWATWMANAHQPNERSLISRNIGDAKVMARALYYEGE